MAQETNRPNNRNEESANQSRGLERRQASRGVSRTDPFLSPAEFFAASPFTLMRRFAEQMDRAWGSETGWEGAGMWAPAVDVSEREGKLMVHADLPGLQKEDVKVECTDDALIIQGERRHEHEEEDGGYRRSERRYGSFYRTIPLPEGAQTDQAHAEFRNGVLEVSVPIPTKQRSSRQIPIEAGTSSERKPAGSENTGQVKESKTG